MVQVNITNPDTNEVSIYYLEDRLKRNLDKIKKDITKSDKDVCIAITGPEGAGKSTFAMQIGKYIDPTLNLSRVVFTGEGFKKAIMAAGKQNVVIFDEAFTGLSSRSALSRLNKQIVSMMMQMRQRNLFVIIVLPSFFLLDKYVALWRTRGLLHVYENKGRRGYFIGFNDKQKKKIYLLGKKTYSYSRKFAHSNFKGRFYGKFALGDKSVEEEYKRKKEEAFAETSMEMEIEPKYLVQRNCLIAMMHFKLGVPYNKIAKLGEEYDLNLKHVAISDAGRKYKEKKDKIHNS